MEFIDLFAQQKRIRNGIENRIRKVLDHGRYIMGPEIGELEETLATYCGMKHCLTCASGTDALLLSLMANDVGPGDAVFTTPFTFMATAEVISLLGATPVFTDIDPKTFNIDPESLEEALQYTKRPLIPKCVIAVDLFGLPADYERIDAITKKQHLSVIEDAAQSFGSEYKGKKACALAETACTSFFPAKPLGCYGDGGAVFTDDPDFMEKLESLRIHGMGKDKYQNVRIGINGRMDTLQAAILLEKMTIFPEEVELRNKVAKTYTNIISQNDYFVLQEIPSGSKSVFAQFSILAVNRKHRNKIIKKLKKHGIPTAIYYPIPLHLQPAFEELEYREGDFPVTEDAAERIFSIPMHPYLTDEEIETIATLVVETSP